ncbi:type 1 glutamine amidotransferase [Humidisolicoccus flavus]|uniref:type 1 glutamine amidotransferase n=1 Tax=Humidisolicoccus flavus TaxID=3111414 RepID=UPI00324314E9
MRSRYVLVIKHIDFETGGHAATATAHLPTADAFVPRQRPDLDELAGLVILGGTMSAADVENHPSIALTTQLARDAIEAEIPTVGLCLGHQILGIALGARHQEGAVHEIGLHPVDIVAEDPWIGAAPGSLEVVQWHNDVVDLPQGATLLASNATWENQAFRYGSAVGMQFHLEVDDRTLGLWLDREDFATRSGRDARELRAQYRANSTLHDAAKSGFRAFAEACASRI